SEDSAHTRAAHESLGIGHDVSSLSQNAPIEGFSDLSALRSSPPVFVASSGGSSRNNADTTGERFCDREFAVHNLELERRQGARGRAVDHRRALRSEEHTSELQSP